MTGPRTGVTGGPIGHVAAAFCAVAFSRTAAVVRPGPAWGCWASRRVLRGAPEVAQSPALHIGVLGPCQALLLALRPGMCSSGEAVVPGGRAWLLGC